MTEKSVAPSRKMATPVRHGYRWPFPGLFFDWDRWLWPDVFSDWDRHGFFPESFMGHPDAMKMRVEEFEDDGALVIRGEIPGVDPDEDIEITVENGRLRIHAERRESSEADEDGAFRSEFSYGSYSRTLVLPPGVTEDDIKASYSDGILEVRLPLNVEEAEARKVPITHS